MPARRHEPSDTSPSTARRRAFFASCQTRFERAARTDDDASETRTTSRANVLAGLAPLTRIHQPDPRRGELRLFADWVRAMPAYELRVGRDPRGVARAVREPLERHGEDPS